MKQQTQPDNRRGRWFADPRLQCGLLARTILYWLYSVSAIGAIALVWIVFARRPQTPAEWIDQLWLNCGPLVAGSILILPLVMLDCLRFSSRFAGPMIRFRRALHDLANGDPADKIDLREGDFWFEFARDLNRVSRRLEANQSDGKSTSTAAGNSKPKADATFDAMKETAEFTPPVADDLNPPPTEADIALVMNSATATDPGAAFYEGSPESSVSIYG